MRLKPNNSPWTVLSSVMPLEAIRSIVIFQTFIQIRSLTDVKLALRVFEYVYPKHMLDQNKRGGSPASPFLDFLAPQVGLEPTTLRLTAECSAIELLRNKRPHIAFNYVQGAKAFL